jgi:hypothetical protein
MKRFLKIVIPFSLPALAFAQSVGGITRFGMVGSDVFPLPRFLGLVTRSAKIVHWTVKGIQAIAICAALCAMAMAADDGDPATCPPSKIPVWGTWYHGKALCFVGTDPRNGPYSTIISTPVIPVELRFLDSHGNVVETLDPSAPFPKNPKLSAFYVVLDSPVFQAREFKFGETSMGTVQWMEATLRASFWKYPGAKFDNWHITMVPFPGDRVTLDVPQTDWYINSSDHFHEVDKSLMSDFITDQLLKYEANYEGTLPIFLVYNAAVYNPNQGGYHQNIVLDGNNNPYIFTGYYDGDINLHALSHEVAEFAHDPFISNKVDPWPKGNVPTPWDPSYVFTQKDCGTKLEVGDPVGDKQTGNGISIDTPAMTYNFQNIAVASWFMDATPSFSVNGWYTLSGAISGEFAAPAPACPSVPHVDTVSPDSGALEGGTKVTVSGDGLSSKFTFDFGSSPATDVTCPDDDTCTMVTPSHNKPESVDVIVKKSPAGDSNTVQFKYLGPAINSFIPSVGPTTGGLSVGITGVSLSDHMTVKFGDAVAKDVVCDLAASTTDCTVTSPAGSVGVPVRLTVTVDGFTSAPSKDLFSFAVFPELTLISPSSGTTGSPITITGTGFSTAPGGTTFTFNGTPATGVTCAIATKCAAVVPGMTTQTVYVVATVDGHTSLNGAVFTNTARLPPPPPR